MSKGLLIILLLLTLTGLGVLAPRLFPELFPKPSPLPYKFQQKTTLLSPQQLTSSRKSTLLIVGDRHGRYFDKFLPQLRKALPPLISHLTIANISGEGQGIHRSLKKIKELGQDPKAPFPPLVLFLGGFDEFYEHKFKKEHYHALLENFRPISTHPWLGELHKVLWAFQKPPFAPQLYGEKITKARIYQDPVAQQKNLELWFKTYQWELQEMIELVVKAGGHLILTTAPLNLHRPPRQVCGNTTSSLLKQALRSYKKRLERGESKKLARELSAIEKVIVGNSEFFSLLGKAHLINGQKDLAKKYLIKSQSFDCAPLYSSPILNNITRLKARETKYQNSVKLLDFQRMLPLSPDDTLVFDRSPFPRDKYYEGFVEKLAFTISRKMKRKGRPPKP